MTDEYPYNDTFSLQPLVDHVKVEKKVFDTLQKNNLDLMEKLNKAKTALEVIATHTVFADAPKDRVQQIQTVCDIAEDALKEIEK